MKVFLAGASGVIGRALMPLLVQAGHAVTGMTRSADRAEAIRSAGAMPFVCDVYDTPRLREGMASARPDVVIHQLTRIPKRIPPALERA